MHQTRKTFRKVTRYYCASALAFLLDLTLTFFLSSIGFQDRHNFLLTGVLVTIFLFVVSSTWVFKDNFESWKIEAPRFLFVAITNIVIAQLLLTPILTNTSANSENMHILLVRFIILFILATFKFFVLDKWVFKVHG